MQKHKGYYYTTKVSIEVNNSTPVKMHRWYIRGKKGEILQSSEDCFFSKSEAEDAAMEHINEFYY